MRVAMLDEVITYENKLTSVDELFLYAEKLLTKEDSQLSHMVIDGSCIYENHRDYIVDHLPQIQSIEIVIQSASSYEYDLTVSAADYINQIVPQVIKLANGFYSGANETVWIQFEQLLEGLQWLIRYFEIMEKNKNHPQSYQDYSEVHNLIFDNSKQLADAMKQQDTTLIADLLTYEILPMLEKAFQIVEPTIDNEVVQHDHN